MEFQVGAIPRISCVQLSGTPSARALMPISMTEAIRTLRMREISFCRLVILTRCAKCSHIRGNTAQRFFCVGSQGAETPYHL